jgi:hypothetical protein
MTDECISCDATRSPIVEWTREGLATRCRGRKSCIQRVDASPAALKSLALAVTLRLFALRAARLNPLNASLLPPRTSRRRILASNERTTK